MADITKPSAKVTIAVPHYKTLELTKLCLRSLKKFTDLNEARVIVVDNGSNDESTEYLRTVEWINLVEREPIAGESGPLAHSRALDLALEMTQTPYYLSIHTDTIVTSDKWLDFLLSKIEKDDQCAGVGSWKLEFKSPVRVFLKKLEERWQRNFWHPATGRDSGRIAGYGDNYYYLRSHCALYKTDLVRKHTNGFSDGGETAGKVLHKKLIDAGYTMKFIPTHDLIRYMQHLNHATMVLCPDRSGKKTGTQKEYNRIMQQLNRINSTQLLADEDLDKSIN